jgi:YD repeat-containing protein
MYLFVAHSSLRVLVALAISTLLLTVPIAPIASKAAARSASEAELYGPVPKFGPPEAKLPDVTKKSSSEPRTPPALASTVRSHKFSPLRWNGRKVGDPLPGEKPTAQDQKKRRAASHHARTNASQPVFTFTEQFFIEKFFEKSVARTPSTAELNYWLDIFRKADATSHSALLLAVAELGKTLFESADYVARGRTNSEYVYDLYKAYLMIPSDPDSTGWSFWTGEVAMNGREQVRRAFDLAGDLNTLMGDLTLSGSASGSQTSLATARVDRVNQPGSGLLGRAAEWSVPIIALPGRASMNLGLTLSYSSQVWTRSGPYQYFDEDIGFPSAGFRLGFPVLHGRYFDAQVGAKVILMVSPSGARTEFRQVGTSTTYEAADSSYMQLVDNTSTMTLRVTDGTKVTFSAYNDGWHCTEIKDRNGNYFTITQSGFGRIGTITDTLGRVITFNYDSNSNLTSITQSGMSQPWATFQWTTKSAPSSYSGTEVVGAGSGTIPVISQVGLPDGSYTTFNYTSDVVVDTITRFTSDTVQRSSAAYAYTTSSDSPRLTSVGLSAYNWTGINGVPSTVTTTYSESSGVHSMTSPDGTIYKEIYGTGWQKGLVTTAEFWVSSVKKKWIDTTYAHDGTSGYATNPRVTETNVYDDQSNQRRTGITYNTFTLPSGVSCSLPSDVTEYGFAGNMSLTYRRTHTEYVDDSDYISRRIISLPETVEIFDIGSNLKSKTGYKYDWSSEWLVTTSAAATQHDSSYSTSFALGRGNLSEVMRYDISDPTNYSKGHYQRFGYNINGSVTFNRNAVDSQTSFSYSDSFSDNTNRNTFAYRTTITDPASNSSYLKFKFETGGPTRSETPAPAGQTTGTITTTAYDSIGRVQQTTVTNNSAYTRYVYDPDAVKTYSTVNTVADEAFSIQVFDGAGRVIATASNHPGSTGGYRGVLTVFDKMGRAVKVSNPTETSATGWPWTATGDDSSGNGINWRYTEQTYDWQGRPLVTTHPDGTYKTAEYSGCGCAGGAVVTLTDEGTIDPATNTAKRRQQKIYSDLFGRESKIELLNWEGGSVYSTRVMSYTILDQLGSTKHYQGAESSGVYQEVYQVYDDYGRLALRKAPIEYVYNTFSYYKDDKPHVIQDARSATTTYTYNSRGLPTSIAYAGGIDTPTVSYTYDNAGNKLTMSDSTGSVTYEYDSLSQVTSETKVFTGLTGSYQIGYEYGLAGQMKSITDHTGAKTTYAYDNARQLTGVTGTGTQSAPTYASDFSYRASGAIKGYSFGWMSLSTTKNLRLQQTSNTLTSETVARTWTYNHYADGRLKQVTDPEDDKFDRNYKHDHIGRLKEATTGDEARGGTTADGPYKQVYTYDVWENVTGRSGHVWGTTSTPSFSYTNNKRSGWSYNNEGQVTSDDNNDYTYNSPGNQVSLISKWYTTGMSGQPRLEVAQTFDGNKGPVKKTTTNRWDELVGEDIVMREYTETIYYLRSSVIGEVIATLNDAGTKTLGYVYAGKMLLATVHISSPVWAEWAATDPKTGSEYVPIDLFVDRKELDPLGNDVTFPPSPEVIPEPVYYNPKYEPMPVEYAGGQTEEGARGMAEWEGRLAVTQEAIRVREAAEAAWQSGDRDKAMQIVASNPNVGVEYRSIINGKVTASGSYFGQEAADFLLGLDIAISGIYSENGGANWLFEASGSYGGGGGETGAVEQALNENQKKVVGEAMKKAVEALKRSECAHYVASNTQKAGVDPGTELNNLQNSMTYFHGSVFARGEPAAMAAVRGGYTNQGPGEKHIVLGYLFFAVYYDEATGKNRDAGINHALIILHEYKHYTENRKHNGSDNDNSAAWNANIKKYCFN